MKTILNLVAIVLFGGCVATGDHISTEHLGEAKQSVAENIINATFTLSGTTTTIQTGEMPKDWFYDDARKSPITVTWSMNPTACHAAASGQFNSVDTGTLTPIFSPSRTTPIGYTWSATHDLAGLENHWHNFVGCDGLTVAVGCTEDRKVSYTLSVGGPCVTTGGTCTDMGAVALPAMQDGDVQQANCGGGDEYDGACNASLGACISACQHSCDDDGDDSDCGLCCVCTCKEELHEADADCPAPQANCYSDDPNHPACLDNSTTPPAIILRDALQ